MNNVDKVVTSLKEGGTVLVPTDTVYGLAASPLFPEAVSRIFSLKGRPQNMNLPIMVAKTSDLTEMGIAVSEAAQRILDSSYVPGAVTLILGFEDKPKAKWLEGRVEVAIRIPDSEFMLAVLERTGPLMVTSANRHGKGNALKPLEEIVEELVGEPNVAVEGPVRESVPSTIINCTTNPPKIERAGLIPEEELFKVIGL